MKKLHSPKIFIVFFIFFFSGFAFAQTGTIRGFVYTKDSGEPVLFTTVFLKGTTMGNITDVNGFFSITKIPPGNYTIFISSTLGYDTLKENVSVKAGEIVTKKLFLSRSNVNLKAVEISGERETQQTETQVSVNKIDPLYITKLPSVGGEPDLAQYLQVIPGVVFTGDQGGQLYIRGGSPIQNKTILDGMVIYNPFHSIGLFSVFDADIIRNADVYTGGFGAEYGGRISSIIDITTRDGNKNKVSGKIAASTFGAKTLIEGPLFKNKENGKIISSFILSAKTSYLPTSSKLLYSYIDPNGLNFSFNDYYGKLSFKANNGGSKINLFGFNFNDKVIYKEVQDMNWDALGGGGNFLFIPGSSSVLVSGNFAYSQYNIKLQPANQTPRTSSIKGFNMGLGFTYFMGRNEINYGLEMLGFRTDFDFYNSSNRHISQLENTSEIGGYAKYKFVSKQKTFLLEPSFRIMYYASLTNFSLEPRLSAKWNITDKIRFKVATGKYSQNLLAANSDRDVVNLFYGFLSGPDNLPKEYLNEDGKIVTVKDKLQKANHYIAGFEFTITKRINLNIEAYRKDFTQLTNLNTNKLFDDTKANADVPDILKNDFIIETGKAKGIDATIKYEHKRIYVWLVYSLGYVNRWDGFETYRPHFDRRHNLNLVTSYTFGKNRNWEIDIRWNFGSGFPFKPTGGFYEDQNFNNGINTDYVSGNGELNYFFAPGQVHELPTYHRLDLTIKRSFHVFNNTIIDATIGATNVYNRQNIFYFDRVHYKRVDQLPLIPSASVAMKF